MPWSQRIPVPSEKPPSRPLFFDAAFPLPIRLYDRRRGASLHTTLSALLDPPRSPVARSAPPAYPVAMPAERTPSRGRSIVKALTYRVFIVCLDFVAIYIFTHKVEVALGFMLVSNIYTTVGYFLHERLWARIRWGAEPKTAS